ncbi:hypothetical protein GCM10027361_25850 [Erwinia aphidicola]
MTNERLMFDAEAKKLISWINKIGENHCMTNTNPAKKIDPD